MNNLCCHTLNIRQLTCENGISRTLENDYTNLTSGTEIPLNFGYILKYLGSSASNAVISIHNPLSLSPLTFNIPNGSYRVFDLPCECGTYRVLLNATPSPCYVSSSLCCSD